MKTYTLLFTLLISLTAISCSNTDSSKNAERLEGKVKLESINLSAKIAGRLQHVYVQEGQRVMKGDTLAVIEVPELEAKLLQADGALMSAEGQLSLALHGATSDQLQQIQAQIDAAEAQLDFANSSYKRMEQLYIDSLIPAQQFDEIRAKRIAAQSQVQAAKAKQKEVTGTTRPETVQSAKGQVIRANGAKKELLQAMRETVILAPAEMLIETISLKEGELVTPGYTLFTGYKDDGTYFRFTVGERQINAFQLQDTISIVVPGTDRKIQAKLTAVKQLPRYADNTSTAPNRDIGESFYELKWSPLKQIDSQGLYNNSTVFIIK